MSQPQPGQGEAAMDQLGPPPEDTTQKLDSCASRPPQGITVSPPVPARMPTVRLKCGKSPVNYNARQQWGASAKAATPHASERVSHQKPRSAPRIVA